MLQSLRNLKKIAKVKFAELSVTNFEIFKKLKSK
jgi:hypothetical protein